MQTWDIVWSVQGGHHFLEVAVGTSLNLGDRDALAVRDYARAHPYEDVDAKAL